MPKHYLKKKRRGMSGWSELDKIDRVFCKTCLSKILVRESCCMPVILLASVTILDRRLLFCTVRLRKSKKKLKWTQYKICITLCRWMKGRGVKVLCCTICDLTLLLMCKDFFFPIFKLCCPNMLHTENNTKYFLKAAFTVFILNLVLVCNKMYLPSLLYLILWETPS